MSARTMNNVIRWGIPLALALALLVTSLWAAARSAEAEAYETAVENGYARAFVELAGVMEELSVTLGKLQVVSAPNQTVLLLDDVWRLSGSAVSLMSQIPEPHLDGRALNRFVVQLGDYAHALTKKAVRGQPTGDDDREQLDSLYAIAKGISADFNKRLLDGDYPSASLSFNDYYNGAEDAGASSSGGELSDAAFSSSAAQSESAAGGSEAYKSQESIEDFPTLIYDGPFSESAEKLSPRGLSGSAVTEAEAKAIAEKTAGFSLESMGLSNGKIKSYEFSGENANGHALDISVTVQGGHILYFMGSASSGLEGLPPESESERYRDTALFYLESMGYENMQATYAQFYGGCALINCAATQNGVILYSDLVKVWVDREDLSIVGLDARNYLFSHVPRALPSPAISEAEAEALLSARLKVESRALAFIPLTPETELLCYEFKCSLGGEAYILYINAQTGEEEQVFRIIDNEDGQMVV